jgi:Carboxypeptidase regulatory-like domain
MRRPRFLHGPTARVRPQGFFLAVILCASGAVLVGWQGSGLQQPVRAGGAPPAVATGEIAGTVVATDSGQPVEGARLTLSGEELRGSRTAYSNDDGRFVFGGLPAGAHTLRVTKAGYVSVTYGQKNSGGNRFGTPVRALRWSMASGERALSSMGTASTDDRGVYRIYGLAPGQYLVNAVPRNSVVPSQTVMMNLQAMEEAAAASMAYSVETIRPVLTSVCSACG